MGEEIIKWGTLVVAVYAAILSTLNHWHALKRDKPKIILSPMVARLRIGKYRLAFHIQNQGLIDTSIVQIGFTRRWSIVRTIFHPSPPLGVELPIVLPAGAQITVYVPASTMKNADSERLRSAYLVTGHGTTVKTRNGALALYVNNPPDTATDEEVINASEDWGHIIASEHGLPKGTLPGES
ncbi:hypothetical protein H0A73_05180 [Alcaligenaceae bacterium]|nr:hypothetical protein [Alcaligenaceae bacterium]